MIQTLTVDNTVYVQAATLATRLGCTAHWIRLKAHRGEIPFRRFGGRLWFPDDIQDIALPRLKKRNKIKELIDRL